MTNADCRFSIFGVRRSHPDFGLSIDDCRLPIFEFPISIFEFPGFPSGFQISDCRFSNVDLRISNFRSPTADSRLPTPVSSPLSPVPCPLFPALPPPPLLPGVLFQPVGNHPLFERCNPGPGDSCTFSVHSIRRCRGRSSSRLIPIGCRGGPRPALPLGDPRVAPTVAAVSVFVDSQPARPRRVWERDSQPG